MNEHTAENDATCTCDSRRPHYHRAPMPNTENDAGSYYCECGHPWGYHHAERGCTMPLSQHGLPVSSLEVTVRVCGCRAIPPGSTGDPTAYRPKNEISDRWYPR